MAKVLKNYIGGEWVNSTSKTLLDVKNPATGEVMAQVPMSTAAEVDQAAKAAHQAFKTWRETPPLTRARYLFTFKQLLENHFEDLAKICTSENGKTLHESRGSVRRGIENVEVASGIPSLMMGEALEDIAQGIDCEYVRQPLGVYAAITPFNFPAMVPFWFFPYAIATGNTFVLKPSEQVPLSQQLVFELAQQAKIPSGVLNLVNGGKEVVEALCEHPLIKGVSFVGSTPVAKRVYELASKTGKRVQALGGAKNFILVMGDAEPEKTIATVTESCYGCAGERCLAGSVVVLVGDAYDKFRDKIVAAVEKIQIGDGTKETTTMGPVISAAHRDKVLSYIAKGEQEGAKLLIDGRKTKSPNANGYFLGPSVFENVTPEMTIFKEEIFGPVMCILKIKTLDEAITLMKSHPMANAASIFTSSGKSAREFKYRADASMVGVNIGVAAPMSFFPFGGNKGSFFGDLKAHGRDGIQFYTDKKVVISRWF
jgi:malonate-semialdehyde dehydrogenase (acetylating) / methylmalonate-semialdehyde dehydrogenase